MFATLDHVPFLLSRALKFPKLKLVVSMDPMEDGERRALEFLARDKNVKLMDMDGREAILHLSCHIDR